MASPHEAAAFLRTKLGARTPRVGLVLGSGLGPLAAGRWQALPLAGLLHAEKTGRAIKRAGMKLVLIDYQAAHRFGFGQFADYGPLARTV